MKLSQDSPSSTPILINPGTKLLRIPSLSLLTLGLSILPSGCSAGFSKDVSSAKPAVTLAGRVHGGQQPVSGAQVYLYAAGTGGYGTPARSMLQGSGFVTTDANGDFSITGDYNCQNGDQVYLLSTGGNPGLSAGTNNAAIALMSALGPCSALSSTTFVTVNEVSTVVAAYALAGFMTSPTGLSSSGTTLAKVGVTNAFLNAANLANTTSGAVNTATPSGNGSVPAAEINTLADILAACVNSDGTGSACSTLFTATTSSGSAAPTNTAQAILNIAHNPGINVGALYNLGTPISPFQPTLASAPHDWSVAVTFTGGGLTSQLTGDLNVDGLGNVWVITEDQSFVPGRSQDIGHISVFDPTGTPLSANGYTAELTGSNGIQSFAIDRFNNAWLNASDLNGPRILKINSNGVVLSPAEGYTGGGINQFSISRLAFDSAGNLWVTGFPYHGSMTFAEFNSTTGMPISPSTGYVDPNTGTFVPSLFATGTGEIWAAGLQFSTTGLLLRNLPTPSFAFGANGPSAIDTLGNIWSGGQGALLEYDSSGQEISPPGGYPAGLLNTSGIVIDGLNRIWYSDPVYSGVIGVTNDAGTDLFPAGYHLENDVPFSGTPYKDIDGSGNLWLATDNQSLVEFVGIAAPVVRPLAAAVATNSLGARP